MKANPSFLQVIIVLVASTLTSHTLAAPPAGKGGGPPGSGGGGATKCFVKITEPCDLTIAEPDLFYVTGDGYTPDPTWTEVFREEFNLPLEINADQSGSFQFNTWSSRYPYGDVKVNKPSGDEGYNVNTTGNRPGQAWVGNHYPAYDALLTQLSGDDQNVFSNSGNALTVQTYEKIGSWKNRLIGKENLFSGLISSHADPENSNPHGFEFRYGYVEAKVKLPAGGNGFRSAVWLHSDNSFYNQYASDNSEPIPERYEIDFVEYIPNSRETVVTDGVEMECFRTQSDVFGGSDNTETLTYDTIFHTYHFPPDDSDRSPNNWTFNADERYKDNRCSVDPDSDNGIDYGKDWHVFGLLWEHNKLDFYVDGVKVHSVVEDSDDPACIQNGPIEPVCTADVFDSRMYIVASMHMGFQWFEGNTIDMNQFESASGAGPKMEIDYIKVLQKPDTTDPLPNTSHRYCGTGIDPTPCGIRQNPETL